MTEIKSVEYGGWPNCTQMSNGIIDLIITRDVGPRVIRLGLVGQPNEFYEDPQTLGAMGDSDWHIYGGHRLWHAPEHLQRTYHADNHPVTVEQSGDHLTVTQPVEPNTGMVKQMEFGMAADRAHVRVVHRLTNTNLWDVQAAPWALSVMAAGGKVVFPLPPRGSHSENLLPASTLTLWAYTNMADPRWYWGERFIMLSQADAPPQKIGASIPDGWSAFLRDGRAVIKRFAYDPNATYPDHHCNFETFTNEVMQEVETLGAYVTIPAGDSVEHVEDWYLFDNVPEVTTEADVIQHILPLVESTR